MARSPLTPEQMHKLIELLRGRRIAHGYSQRDIARLTGIGVSTISEIENGEYAPAPVTLRAWAEALDIPMTEVLLLTGWLPAEELTTLKPFFRAKYPERLTEADIAALDAYARELAAKHGTTGPQHGEDELP